MTELQLYKYITENDIEWHRYENNGEDDVLIFPYFYQLEDFKKIISGCIFDEGDIEVIMKDGYLCIWMRYICEYYGIDMNRVFRGKCAYI